MWACCALRRFFLNRNHAGLSCVSPYNQEDQSVLTVPFRVVPDPDRLTDPDALFKYETF